MKAGITMTDKELFEQFIEFKNSQDTTKKTKRTQKYTKRKDGRYSTSISVGVDVKTGKPITIKIYAKTISELEEKKSLIKSDYSKGNNIITKKIIFNNYASNWLKSRKPFVAHATYVMYDQILRLYVDEINYLEMKSITRYDIQNIINNQIDKPRTCKKIKVTLNQIFESAYLENIVNRNPTKKIELPKYAPTNKRALTYEEDILSDITNFTDREKAYVLLLKWFGLRKEEALALTIDDFDFKSRSLSVNKAVEFIHNKPIIKDVKSKSSNRLIPIVDKCYDFLKYYVGNLKQQFLFTSLTNNRLISESSFQRMFQQIILKMNNNANKLGYHEIVGLSSHTFRHNYASMLYENNIPLKETQYLLGHASINVTMDIYTHLDEKSMKMNKLLSSFSSKKIQ